MVSSPKNPWRSLPRDEFVLSEDLPFALEFNRRARGPEKLVLDLVPEPFFGRRDAPIVLLLLNPGVGQTGKQKHHPPDFAAALRADIAGDSPKNHFHLSNTIQGPGQRWWLSACRELIREAGLAAVSRNLLSIEFSPYHSQKFAHGLVRFPSQSYSFWLVEEAIRRNAVIVCMRGLKQWFGAVPSLGSFENLQLPRSTRSGSLSSRNLDSFEKLVETINLQPEIGV
ncbi:MAG: hypothetical protein JNL67_04205 [Planctomycetaceae bacterium]|nr:hypothetical protein [Planctomycetaceae bacterium]